MLGPRRQSTKAIIASTLALAVGVVMIVTTAIGQEAPRDSGTLIKSPTIKPPTARSQTTSSGKVGSSRRRKRRARRARARAAVRRTTVARVTGKPREVQGVVVDSSDRMPHNGPGPSPTRTSTTPKAPISGGVLNGRALVLPLPVYPPLAKAANAAGTVEVRVLIDEDGKIAEAEAISGPPLLRKAAEDAAKEARFAPTQLSGEPVRVTGVITYDFVVPQ